MACCAGALTGFAGLSAMSCGYCGEPTERETSCQIWFKGSGKGKISCNAKSQMYKTVKTMTIKDCQLIISGGESNAVTKVLISGTKKGVGEFTKTLECSEFVWNVFGKKLDKVLNGSTKGDVQLDSEMFFKANDEDNTMEIAGVLTGKVKAKATGGCTPCGDDRSVKYTPGKFSGRFVGWSEAVGCGCAGELTASLGEGTCSDKACLTFVEPETDAIEVFYGTITLKYDSKDSGYISRIVID